MIVVVCVVYVVVLVVAIILMSIFVVVFVNSTTIPALIHKQVSHMHLPWAT